MAMTFSRPDPSSPSAVAAANFSTSRRGFDQTEVRDLLRMVAAELARLQEREKFLERELRAAQHHPPTMTALDDEVVTKLLGEEAVKILTTAREAASQIRVRADETAARVVREATDEAHRLREEAEIDTARRRSDATADAEAELEMAKQQGREMVNEARAYRERVLGELSRRREAARAQIEQLVHGRDRLLQAFERARLVSVDIVAELASLGEPNEYVNLSPTTGPVPVMIPATPRADLPAAPRPEVADAPAPHDATRELPNPPDAVTAAQPRVADVAATVEAVDDDVDDIADDDVDDVEPVGADRVIVLREEFTVVEHGPEDAERESATVVALFAGELEPNVPLDPPTEHATPAAAHPSVSGAEDDARHAARHDSEAATASAEGLFAKLRAARLDAVAEQARHHQPHETAPTPVDEAPASAPAPRRSEKRSRSTATSSTSSTTADPTETPAVFKQTPAAPEAPAADDQSPFGRRDAELTPLIVAAARKIKRVLADEQNDLLHALTAKKTAKQPMSLVPDPVAHATRYAEAISTELHRSAVAGAGSMVSGAAANKVDDRDSVEAATASLTAWLVQPLRERLERVIGAADGDHEEIAAGIRALYREWKTQRIDMHLDDVLRTAYGHGQLAALKPGERICWMVDPNGPACPDAEDNALGGVTAAGQPFPTTHTCAPAHEGCRCLLVRAEE